MSDFARPSGFRSSPAGPRVFIAFRILAIAAAAACSGACARDRAEPRPALSSSQPKTTPPPPPTRLPAPTQAVGGANPPPSPRACLAALAARPDASAQQLAGCNPDMLATWRAVLDRLRETDVLLAKRVERRLVGERTIRGRAWRGDRASVWSEEFSSLDLLHSQLATAHSQAELRERVDQWLNSLPPFAAWIVDDAGVRHPRTGDPMVTIAVANLRESDATCSFTFTDRLSGAEGALAAPELATLPSNSITQVQLASTLDAAHADPRQPFGRPLGIRIAGTEVSKLTFCQLIRVRPPGLPVGPLLPDIDPLAPESSAPAVSPLTAGVLQKDPAPAGSPAASHGSWTLYLECATASAAAQDRIELWFGPFGAPTAVLAITPDGTLSRRTAGASAAAAREARVPTQARDDRWSCWVPVPPECIEPDGLIRLGVFRIIGDGPATVRTSWPRAVLPWQTEPSRLLLDLTAW